MPPAMAQEGVADSVGIDLRHLSQYVRPLVLEGQVRERTAHVAGARQRRKVYELTPEGQRAAVRLRERVRAEPVRVRSSEGVREMTLEAAVRASIGGATLLDLARRSLAGEPIDLGTPAPSHGSPLRVALLAEAPRIERFVGRQAELDALLDEGGGPRVTVIRGVAGIGKTSLASKACELLRGRRNLYWHTVREWDSRASVLSALSGFLAQLGRPGLKAALAGGPSDACMSILRNDLPGSAAFLVFDDAHLAGPEVVPLFRFLKEAVQDSPDVHLVILTRRSVPFYDRRDVAVRGLVREVDLGGLSPADVGALVGVGGEAAPTELGRRLGGHPLLLELARSAGPGSVHGGALRNVERFIEEEIYAELSEPERITLKAASLYQVPVPREALFADASVTHDALVALTSRTLLRVTGDDGLSVHDTVRDYFARILSPLERRELAQFTRAQLRGLAARARDEGNLAACIGYLSNALQLASSPEDRSGVLEELGDAHERIGDLPAALVAYREARGLARDPGVVARLHRKAAAAHEVRGDLAAATEEVDGGFRALADVPSVERGWLNIVRCGILTRQEAWEAARDGGRSALETFRVQGDRAGQAHALLRLGNIEIDAPRSDPRVAERCFDEALELAGTLRDDEFTVRVQTALAHLLAYRLGDVDGAQAHLAAIEGIPRAMDNPHVRRAILMLRGWLQLELLNDCEAAVRCFLQVVELAGQIYDPSTAAFARYGVASCAYYQGRLEEARGGFRAFAEEILGRGFPGFAAEGWWLVAECSLRIGDLAGYREAVAVLRSPRLAAGLKARPVHGKVLEGTEAAIRRDLDGTRRAFGEALRIAQEGYAIEEPSLVHFAHFAFGVALLSLGDAEGGRAHIREANQLVERNHLRARASIAEDVERQVVEALRRAAVHSEGGR